MKKIISMLLVLTMVVTTLMGVMVIDVNALSQVVNEDANSTAGLKITIGYGQPSFPAKTYASNGTIREGSWYAYGYTYADVLSTTKVGSKHCLTDDTQVVTGTKTDEVHFLDAEVVSNPLAGDMMKYDFKKTTIVDESYKAQGSINDYIYDSTGTTQVSYNKSNYLRIAGLTPLKADAFAGYNFGSLPEADITATKTNSTAYKITFYAYTQNVGDGTVGSSFYVESRNPNIVIKLEDEYVVSERGVPHKVDLVWSSDGTKTVYHMYIDGVEMSAGNSGTISTSAITLQPRFEASIAGINELTVNSTDWYITQPETKITFGNALSQAEVSDSLIVVPNYTAKTQSTNYRTDDYITGVIASLDADIKAVLETTTAGDKVVDIYESKYNNLSSLFDTTVENPTVKLVSRTTGEEVAPASATGTMDNYYFMVNGIYIIPNKVADPIPYEKLTNDPFAVKQAEHNTIVKRMKKETYETTPIAADQPAFGGLRSGFLKFTNEPRSSFTFSGGGAYYNQAGYYGLNMPGMIKYADKPDISKGITTLQFDMYAPEYTYSNSCYIRLVLSGYRNDASTSNANKRTSLPAIYFTTNGMASDSIPANSVDLVGNAWNNVIIQFDATNTPTSKNLAIIVYVNGEKQLETASTTNNYDATAENYISFLEYARLYMPSYTSVGIMNDAWYIGDYMPAVTATTENEINSANVPDVIVSVDSVNNLVVYDNSDDTDYEKLIAAMEAADYTAVYDQVVDAAMVDAKYNEVDGSEDYSSNSKTHTGVLVKRWIESSLTDADIVNNGDTDGDGKNNYTIVDTNILTAVDNGDNTATMTTNSSFKNDTVYAGIAHTTDEIVELLAEEGKVGITKTLIGFTSVNETGKLPRVYTLQGMGTELYSLGYDETTKVATLNYREFGGTENISFILIVGAYDANGKLLALDISGDLAIDSANEADGVKTKTFTADFGTLDLTTVSKYKVFAFNSIAERKPIMANYAMMNPAYVAPVK